ncbi:hypothetical protein Dform_00861 [Dehalogenimonas formicexedens]|uniref:Uncharacterized protein n=1 Tax=Dehalogenimonas formicexedens TaxID=1839801 RepID=A0A1P8F6U4_9CHLR|nr:hypothetical protein [Dehalogenimonas formicexedens]APV44206.1 hypothetical protein Dform_00861 [Dehalogenimonas formicexedens]
MSINFEVDARPKLNPYELAIILGLLRRAELAAEAENANHAHYHEYDSPYKQRADDLHTLRYRLEYGGRSRVTRPVDLGDLSIPTEKRLL